MTERVRRRAFFYTARALPQAHSHCTLAVLFQETLLKCKLSFLMAQVVVLDSVNPVISFSCF